MAITGSNSALQTARCQCAPGSPPRRWRQGSHATCPWKVRETRAADGPQPGDRSASAATRLIRLQVANHMELSLWQPELSALFLKLLYLVFPEEPDTQRRSRNN